MWINKEKERRHKTLISGIKQVAPLQFLKRKKDNKGILSNIMLLNLTTWMK